MSWNGFRKALHQINKIRFRPLLLAKIAQAYLRTWVFKMPTLRIIEFSITPECQSKCEFCYASKFHRSGARLLTLAEIKDVWRQAKALGAFSTVVFGGEPLLHPQFFEIIRLLEPRKHIVTFTTNAIALTEETVIRLKAMGVFLVNISLNSLDSALNDRLRGYPGHFDKVMRAIELCRHHGVDVFLPVATSKRYLKETLEIIEFAKKAGLGVTINLMCAMGRSENRFEELFDESFWSELRRLYDANPDLRSDFDVNLDMHIGCPGGFEKIHIAPYGDVTGCSMNPVSFGNIREMPLREILRKMQAFHHFSKRHPSCIVAVDQEYIENYMNIATRFSSLPYPVEANPFYPRDQR